MKNREYKNLYGRSFEIFVTQAMGMNAEKTARMRKYVIPIMKIKTERPLDPDKSHIFLR